MAVFALALLAVAREPIPWVPLAWTIPAINILSCFPISIAGAGVRDVAAVTLLGWYGIAAGDAVAAAMVTLFVKLAWAGAGGVVFWREHFLQSRAARRPVPRTLSVVIPTNNEEGSLPETLRRLARVPEVGEILVVDGGSSDRTVRVAKEHGCRVLTSERSRGRQLRLGSAQATGDVVLMLHADTWLPKEAGRAALDALRDATVVGGGYWKTFRDPPWLMRGSRFKCATRLWIWKGIAGDQAMFVRREVLEQVGGVPDMPLMEEFALCRRLNRAGRLALAGATVRTSVRRFREHGVLRTYFLMAWIHLLYRLGCSASELKRIYESGWPAFPRKQSSAAPRHTDPDVSRKK